MASIPQGGCIKLPRLLAAAVLAAGCSDAITPATPRTPAFATDATEAAIALWGFNGTLPPQTGTILGKEFNPENPPPGSTVVATFVWVGSSNTIDSVADFLWTGRRIGNQYTLVEYVTAGGISMATYVATNVQNYPYPKTREGDELVINAYLRSPTSAGGALVSAYTGVDPVFAQGLGAHRSASGSGSTTPTNAHPGSITVGAGAFVYAVAMSSDGLVGRTAPAGFTYMTGLATESPSMQFDVEYSLRSVAGSVDPTWGWSFDSPSTWLASAVALNPAGAQPQNQPPVAAFTSSCSALTCGFTSTSSDADGSIAAYNWAFGDGATSTVQNPGHAYAGAGTFTVTLTVTDNLGATNSASHTVTVSAANQPPTAAFTWSCGGLTCTFTSTSSDPDGTLATHAWAFGDGGASGTPNPGHTYPAAGTYTVTLTVTDNQGATGSTSRSVGVSAPNQPPVADFVFSCSALTCAFTSTSGDPDGTITGHSWNFGDGTVSSAQNPSHTYGTAGSYTVTLTVTDDRGAGDAAVQTATVQGGAASPVALDQKNGTLNENGTVFAKGFNPTNPHLGDAIIATFFWVGSTNVITSVSDFITDANRTPVGNTYTLVEYVTAGGISMATYVATNVQGFPDPNPDPTIVLGVQAVLSEPVTDGGMMITAFRGVEPSLPLALAGSQSTSGTGSGITPVDPGAIAVGSGALAYAVSMSNGLFGSDKPVTPFVSLDAMADARMVTDGAYAVASTAGPLHPQWTYHFDGGPYSWLASVLVLNPAR